MSTESNVISYNFNSPTLPDIEINEIVRLIPHRYPMLLVDKVINIDPGQGAVGIKNVSMNEWFFQGHFPEKPIMPGVLIIEALAQTAAIVVMKSLNLESKGKLVYFMSIEEAKFRKPVLPGDVLQLKVNKIKERGNIWKFKGEAWVGDALASEASFTAMISDKE
jgi:3-hydroxyacyl-[acyl-carrier-protein] dehydratase